MSTQLRHTWLHSCGYDTLYHSRRNDRDKDYKSDRGIMLYTSVVAVASRTRSHASHRQLAVTTAEVTIAEAEIASGSGRKTAPVVTAWPVAVRPTGVRVVMLAPMTGATPRAGALVAGLVGQVVAAGAAETGMGRAADTC